MVIYVQLSKKLPYLFFRVALPFLYSSQQYIRGPIAPHFCQHLVWSTLMLAILIGIQWYLILALVCICPMASEVEHVVTCCLSIFMEFLFKSLPIFSLDFIVFLLLNLENSLYILGNTYFLGCVTCQYFLLVCSLYFHSIHRFFHRTKVFNVQLTKLFLVDLALEIM